MLTIRLQRVGKIHQPSYRIVVAERRSKIGAPPVEYLGNYDPFTKKAEVDASRIKYWIEKGAKPSVTAHNLFVRSHAIEGPSIKLKLPAKKVVETGSEAPAEAVKPA